MDMAEVEWIQGTTILQNLMSKGFLL